MRDGTCFAFFTFQIPFIAHCLAMSWKGVSKLGSRQISRSAMVKYEENDPFLFESWPLDPCTQAYHTYPCSTCIVLQGSLASRLRGARKCVPEKYRSPVRVVMLRELH
jgi:hypothetical protein